MRRFKSIQSAIFAVIVATVAAVLAAGLALYLFTSLRGLQSNYAKSSSQLAKILSSRLDTLVAELNAIQVRMIENEPVREFIFSDFENDSDSDIYGRRSAFRYAVYDIAGYSYPFYHLSVLTGDGVLIYFGEDYNFYQLDSPRSPVEYNPAWQEYYDSLLEKRGSKVLVSAEAVKLYEGEPSVAVSRSISRFPLNEHRAVMELQLSLAAVDDTVNAILLGYDNLSNRVVVYDTEGRLVYPAGLDSETLAHYRTMPQDTRAEGPGGSAEFISRYQSPETGWTVVLVTPYSAINEGMWVYVRYAALVGILALAATLLIAFWVARTISRPIMSIKETLLSVDLDTLKQQSGEDIVTRYNELELLKSSVEEMRQKLENSLNDYVQLRSLSIQSRMLALQSQMNPHFLYNTLSIMAILAEENGDEEVSGMCRQLSGMLRYTSTERDSATLRQELEHTRQYAELIRVRFGEKVAIEYDVDDALLEQKMPPILLQPLVENSVKYARGGTAPLRILVQATQTAGSWRVRVSDNGPGFTTAALEGFWNSVQPEHKEDWDKILHRELEGVGLANIYLRMQLFYEGNFHFSIENRPLGASILVGGPLETGGTQAGEEA